MILLPILVVAMERLIRNRKWYMLTVLVGVSLLCSYYFLYMNTIALGIYFVLRIVCTEEYRNWKTFFERGFKLYSGGIPGSNLIIYIFWKLHGFKPKWWWKDYCIFKYNTIILPYRMAGGLFHVLYIG